MESKQQLSQQQDASVSPEPSAPRQSKMKFVVMGFIVLLLLVGVGAYILGMQKNVTQNAQVSVTPTVTLPTPTPDPMAGWKTYNDSQNSFTFRYPSGWFTGKSGDGTILLNDEKITETIVEPNQVTATLEVINDKQLISLYPKNPPENSERKVINDITFDYLKIVNTGGQPPKQPIVAQTVKNDTLYTFALSDLSQKTTFDQILSTFNFTDSYQANNTAGWKTYTNKKFNYSLQMPTIWSDSDPNSDAQNVYINVNEHADYKNNEPSIKIIAEYQTNSSCGDPSTFCNKSKYVESQTVLGGVVGKKWIHSKTGEIVYYLPSNKFFLTASSGGDEELLGKILGTIRFN